MNLLRRLLFLFAALGALVTLITVTPVASWWGRCLSGRFNDPSWAVLVILAGDDLAEAVPGVASYLRALYGLRAWRQGGFRQIIISGEPATTMRDFLVAEAVPPSAIQIEVRSH